MEFLVTRQHLLVELRLHSDVMAQRYSGERVVGASLILRVFKLYLLIEIVSVVLVVVVVVVQVAVQVLGKSV